MVSRKEAELLARRAMLRERIRAQRQALAQAAQPLAAACARVDTVCAWSVGVFRQARELAAHHPLAIGGVIALLMALRPRRVWRWGARLFWMWRASRPLLALLAPFLRKMPGT